LQQGNADGAEVAEGAEGNGLNEFKDEKTIGYILDCDCVLRIRM
jgi:hypothetical protein